MDNKKERLIIIIYLGLNLTLFHLDGGEAVKPLPRFSLMQENDTSRGRSTGIESLQKPLPYSFVISTLKELALVYHFFSGEA